MYDKFYLKTFPLRNIQCLIVESGAGNRVEGGGEWYNKTTETTASSCEGGTNQFCTITLNDTIEQYKLQCNKLTAQKWSTKDKV